MFLQILQVVLLDHFYQMLQISVSGQCLETERREYVFLLNAKFLKQIRILRRKNKRPVVVDVAPLAGAAALGLALAVLVAVAVEAEVKQPYLV